MNTTTDFNAAERVKAGAALLDDRLPGWWKRIDLDRLDLASVCRCILGQLEIDRTGEDDDPYAYHKALGRFDINAGDYEDVALGFDVEGDEGDEPECAALTAAWRSLIADRRTQAAR